MYMTSGCTNLIFPLSVQVQVIFNILNVWKIQRKPYTPSTTMHSRLVLKLKSFHYFLFLVY